MPNLTEEQVLFIAEQALIERDLDYDKTEGLQARFDGLSKTKDNNQTVTWTVSYSIPPLPPELGEFDPDLNFIHIDDTTGVFLYIIPPRTYIE